MQEKKDHSSPIFFILIFTGLKKFFSIRWIRKLFLIFFNLVLLIFALVFLLMYSSFTQSVTAKLFTTYLSNDLGLEVSIDKVSIDVFHHVHLHNFLIKDDKKDTMIFLNDLDIDIQYASIFHNKLIISKIELNKPTIHIIRHKGDKYFNYEKLIEYFSSKDTSAQKNTSEFELKIKQIKLSDADIIYKDEKYNTQTSSQINYDFIKLSHANLSISHIKPKQDTIYFQLENFSANEQSGLKINKMGANIRITPQSILFKDLTLYTNKSVLIGDVLLKYPSVDELFDNIEKNIIIDADLHYPTKIYFSDLYHFAKELKGWDKPIDIQGKISGKINHLAIKDAHIHYAGTEIIGNIEIKGLPDIQKTFFEIHAQSMITTAQAIEQIPLYPFDKKEHIELPGQFKNVGIANFKGDIKGYYHKFKINGILVTQIGDIKLNTFLMIDSISNDLNYNGNFTFYNFHFGKFFQYKNIQTMNADVLLSGKGTIFQTMKTSIQAHIKDFTFNQYKYKNIFLDANLNNKVFTGDLSISDENAQINLTGQIKFDNKIPDMNFTTSIDKLNLNQLHLIHDTRNGSLSGNIIMKLSGDNLDDVTGEILMNNIQYTTSKKIYFFANSSINLKQDNDYHKTFYLHSNFIDLDIQGKFKLSDAENYFNHFLKTFYPSFAKRTYNYKEISKDTFQLAIKIKNFGPISELFTNNQLFIQPHTSLTLMYHPKDLELVMQFQSELISYGSIKFINNQFNLNSHNQQLNSVLSINKIVLSDSLSFKDVKICSHSQNNYAKINMEWQTFKDTSKYTYNGQIGLSATFYPHAMYIIPDAFEIPVGKDKWTAQKLNPIVIDTAYNIQIFPLEFVRQTQSVAISGQLHNQEKDELKINFSNFELQQLNPLFGHTRLHIKGQLNGYITFHQNLKKSIISSDIQINDFYLNQYFIGNISTYSAYQPLNQSLYLKGNLSYDYSQSIGTKLKYLEFEGTYYTAKKDSALDIEIEARPFNLSILNPILKDIMTIDFAFLYGKGKINGTFEKPLISGNFKIHDSKIKTDYLNTYHKIIGTIEVMPDQIRFDEMKIYNYGSKEEAGTLNGNIFHNNFSNMRIDFDINAKNLLVLNTNPLLNKEYYGKVYAAGNVGIYGFINNMNIEANLTSKKNSHFVLSFSSAQEVGENSFVRFINPKDTIKKSDKNKSISGLEMKFIFNTTPDLETEVVFNDKTGDGVKTRGEGTIEMNINSYGKFEMNGEYIIRSGTYLFTLESIINKKFEIENGSKITLVGNPYNTLIDVNANYVQKTSLAPLFPYDPSGTYKRRYPVTAQLSLKGKIISPEILFNIHVAQVDASTKSKIDLLLSDENELNRQFFSLLILKSFVPPLQYVNSGGVSAGSALAANSSEMLSNKLNNALKGISNFVDIGVNYNPGSQTSNQQMELTMSKQLFNNRLSIDGSFGVNNNQTQNTSQIIGDVNIEYKLTESGRYILKAFNRTNNNTQMTISGGPYTQGIGIGYKYEFNSIFNHSRRKQKQKPEEIK